MNRPGHRIVAWLGKAALKTHAVQTLRDCWTSPNRAKRLECVRFIGAFLPARDGQRFMVPMHRRKAEGAFHELTTLTPPTRRTGAGTLTVGSSPRRVRGGFMVEMRR